jgi:outer membrane protein, heavy metal efflux system
MFLKHLSPWFACLSMLAIAHAASTAEQSPKDHSPSIDSSVRELRLDAFLAEVLHNNLDYAAQRYNVDVAQAAIVGAKMFPNPSVQLGSFTDINNRGSQRLPGTMGGMFTQTFETGGKRKARLLVALRNHAATAASLESFLQNLKLDAAAAFADALAQTKAAEQKRLVTVAMQDFLKAEQTRAKAGDVGQLEVTQTAVEAGQLEAVLIDADAEAQNASLALNAYMGRQDAARTWRPMGKLEIAPQRYDIPTLLSSAYHNRADLLALRDSSAAAKDGITLARANRIPNVDVGLGWMRSSSSSNTISPQPAYNMLGFQVTVPIPLFNRGQAEIATAQAQAGQAEKILESAEVKVGVQIRQALVMYQGTQKRVSLFQSGILKDAQSALDGRRLSYQKGDSSLLELLDAQRSADEVTQSYYDALSDHLRATIELHRAAGIWNIQL